MSLFEVLAGKGLNAEYWLPIFKEVLNVTDTCTSILENLTTDDVERLSKHSHSSYERNILQKLVSKEQKDIEDADRTSREHSRNETKSELNALHKDVRQEAELHAGIHKTQLQSLSDDLSFGERSPFDGQQRVDRLSSSGHHLPDEIVSINDDDLINSASGGLVLQGILVLGKEEDLIACRKKLLRELTGVRIDGPQFESDGKYYEFSSTESFERHHKTIQNVGFEASVAVTGILSNMAQIGVCNKNESDTSHSQAERNTQNVYISVRHGLATMASFDMPLHQLRLSNDAINDLKQLEIARQYRTNCEDLCLDFFSKYGTHINTGKIHLGGTFITRAEINKSMTEITGDTRNRVTSSLSTHFSAGTQCVGLSTNLCIATAAGTLDKNVKNDETETIQLFTSTVGGLETDNFADWRLSLQKSNKYWAVIDRGTEYRGVWRIVEKHRKDLQDAYSLADLLYRCWESKTSSTDRLFLAHRITRCLHSLSNNMIKWVDNDFFWQKCKEYVQHTFDVCNSVPREEWVKFAGREEFAQFLNKIQQIRDRLTVHSSESIKQRLNVILCELEFDPTLETLKTWCKSSCCILSTDEFAAIRDIHSLIQVLDKCIQIVDDVTITCDQVNINAAVIFSAALEYMSEKSMLNEVVLLNILLTHYKFDPTLGFKCDLQVSHLKELRRELADFESASNAGSNSNSDVQIYILRKAVAQCVKYEFEEKQEKKEKKFRTLTEKLVEHFDDQFPVHIANLIQSPINWDQLKRALGVSNNDDNSARLHEKSSVIAAFLQMITTEEDQHQQDSVVVENVGPLSTEASDMLQRMNLQKIYPLQLDTETVRQIRKAHLQYSTDGLCVAYKTIVLDYKSLRNSCLTRSEKRSRKRRQNHAESRTAECPSTSSIHWNDVALMLFSFSDNMLKQLLAEKLFLCKFAIPFILPSLSSENNHSVLVWSLRSIMPTWSLSKTNGTSKGLTVVDIPHPIISFIRIGNFKYSKSNLLNQLLSSSGHETFVHYSGTQRKRSISDGLVEISWLLPEDPNDDNSWELDTMISFTNMRGDATQNADIVATLCSVSSLVVILANSQTLNDKSYTSAFHENTVHRSCYYLLCIDSEEGIQDDKVLKHCSDFLDAIFPSNPKAFEPDGCVIDYANQETLAGDIKDELQHCLKHIDLSKRTIAQAIKTLDTVIVDEKLQNCSSVYVNVKNMLEIIHSSHDRNTHLPMQGHWWEEWCKLERKDLREDGVEKSPTHLTRFHNQILVQKTNVRLEQYKLLLEPTKFMTECLKLFANKDVKSLGYTLRWLNIQLGDESKKICSGSEKIGVAHILRELGQIYETLSDLENASKTSPALQTLPDTMAKLMLKDIPLELMDGDVSFVPAKWVKAVFDSLRNLIGCDKRMFVVTVLGVQSSGKSTLLNTMFGLQFAVSSGRCTRGVNCRLIAVDKENTDLEYDYFLVVDTEGLCANETAGCNRHRDNELATFAIGIANVAILNIMGENLQQMDEILQIVIHALIRMKSVNSKINLCPRCIFVHQNVAAVDAKKIAQEGLETLETALNRVTSQAATLSGLDTVSTFGELIEFNCKEDVFYLPGLWLGSPPNAPVSIQYVNKVAQLKEVLVTDIANSPFATYVKTSSIGCKIGDMWRAIVTEDFVTNFRNNLQIMEFEEIEKFYADLKWKMDKESMKLLRGVDFTSADDIDKVLSESLLEVTKKIQSTTADITAELVKFLDENKYNCWEKQFVQLLKIDEFSRITSTKKEIESRYEVRRLRLQYGEDFGRLKTRIRQTMLQSVKGLSEHAIESETDLKRHFDTQWTTVISDESVSKWGGIVEEDIDEIAVSELYKELAKTRHKQVEKELQGATFVTDTAFDWTTCDLRIQNLPQITDDDFNINIFSKNMLSTADRHNKRMLASSCMEKILRTITSFLDIVRREMFVREHLTSIIKYIFVEFADDVHRATGYNLKTKFRITLIFAILKQVIPLFKMMQKTYIEKCDPVKNLMPFRNQLWLEFNAAYKVFKVEEAAVKLKLSTDTAATLLASISISIIEKGSINKLLEDIVEKLCKDARFASKSAFLGSMLEDLQERQTFHDYIEYINHFPSYAKKYSDRVINSVLHSHTDEDKQSTIFSTLTCQIQATESTMHASKVKGLHGDTVEEFLNSFAHEWPSQLDADSFQSILEQRLSSFQDFKNLYHAKLVEATKTCAITAVTIKDVETPDKRNPYDIIYDRVRGCDDQCPLCFAPCSINNKHEGSNHRPLKHYPLGLSGVITSNSLVVESCAHFIDEAKKTQGYTRNAREVIITSDFNTWDVTENRTREENSYWLTFMAQNAEKLSSEFHGAQVPEIPTVEKQASGASSSESGCFFGDATVLLSNGRHVKVSDLTVGERVLTVDCATGQPYYDEVITFLDRCEIDASLFVVIQTESGNKLTLTPTHLIYAGNTPSKTSACMVFADEVTVGNYVFCLQFTNADCTTMAMNPTIVTNVYNISVKSGKYSPLTKSGKLVVDGIVVSCYALFKSHQLAQMAMLPLRAAYYVSKTICTKHCEKNICSENGQHHYAKALVKVCRYLFPSSWWWYPRDDILPVLRAKK